MSFLFRLKSVRKEYHTLFLVSFSGFLYTLGSGVAWFVLPILAEKLFKDLMIVGVLIATPNIVSLFFDIPMGDFSDRVGRKKLFMGGLLLMALLGLMLPSVSSFMQFVAFMVLLGVANLGIILPVRAYIMEIAPKEKVSECFGIFEAAIQVGFAVAPLVGGYLIADNFSVGISNSGIFMFLGVLAAALILSFVKDTVSKGESAFVSIKDTIVKDRLFLKSLLDYKDLRYAGMAILFATFITVSIDGVIWAFAPLYSTLGIDTATVGLILSMFVIPFILFEVPAGVIADKFGKIKVFTIGLIIAGVFLLVFGHTENPTILLASAFIATAGLAFARPAMDGLLTDISAKKERGSIVGVWDTAEDFAYAVSPIAGGLIGQLYGIRAVFIIAGGLLLLSIPLLYTAITKK
jgi:DHA1 family multidrug resistance protein-like MFS transporter